MAALTATAGGVALRVRLTPGAAHDRIDGLAADAAGQAHLGVRVRAIPEAGKANAALEALLARAFGVAKSAVSVERGTTARIKTVHIAGLDLAAAQAILEGGE